MRIVLDELEPSEGITNVIIVLDVKEVGTKYSQNDLVGIRLDPA